MRRGSGTIMWSVITDVISVILGGKLVTSVLLFLIKIVKVLNFWSPFYYTHTKSETKLALL